MDEKAGMIADINVGLREIQTYLIVFEEYAHNFMDKERLEYANGILSMISMQSAKVDKLCEIAEQLEIKTENSKE